jgi:hypothetical protein
MTKPHSIGGQKFPTELGNVIMSALNSLPEVEYANGRTAEYWHIMEILDSHLVRNHND